MDKKSKLLFAATIGAVFTFGVFAGIEYKNIQLVRTAERITSEPTDSLTRCILDSWSQTGELNAAWRGKKRWILRDLP
jgi:hypothetical protein